MDHSFELDTEREAQSLFVTLIDLQPDQRIALLQKRAPRGSDLRVRVEALLLGLSDSDSFMERSLLTGWDRDDSGDQLGSGASIGGYQILAKIGSGGMGSVYLARQEAPNRQVALKLLRLGSSESSLRRFHYEAQTLARLQHPHIVPLYEYGTHVDPVGGESLPFLRWSTSNRRGP